jgi:CIC family chloride channel protein
MGVAMGPMLRHVCGLPRRLTLPLRQNLRDNGPVLIALCAPLGALVGFAVVMMHELVSGLHWLTYGIPIESSLSAATGIPWLRIALVPAGGGLALGLLAALLRRFRQHEIIDPVEANALYGGRMSLLESCRLAALTLISNGVGAALGLEAAFTQIGAGILSLVGQKLRLRRSDLRVFVASGTAAAIAAAFNAPLAGAFYAFELVLGSYSPSALAQVAMASLAGTLVMRSTVGVAPIFLVDAPAITVSHWQYPLFALLGVGAAGIGILTMRLATWIEAQMRRLPTPDWLRPAIGGLLLSCVAIPFPQVLGSGHGAIQWLFDSAPPVALLLVLLAAKIVASALSLGAGFRGGLFSTSLFLGCLYGDGVSRLVGLFGPWLAGQYTIFTLVGMGAVAASIVGAPITMVLLVLEVTGDFNVALAVLAGVVMANTITRYRFGYSFSTWRFHQRGKQIRGAYDVGWLADLSVAKMLRADVVLVAQGTPLLQMREQVPLGTRTTVFSIDDGGRFAGAIEITAIHDHEFDDAAVGLVASDLAGPRSYFLLPEMDVRTALARFEESETETLPVLAAADDPRVIGYVSEAYALKQFAHEMERQHSAQLGEQELFSIWPASAPVD